MGLNSVISGLASGLISTFITHPFEIIRTHIQVRINFDHEVSPKEKPLIKQLASLVKEGKLFNGVTPRLIKKPLSNTLAFLLF